VTGRNADHSRTTSGEVKNAWKCTFISPHSFMVCPETTLSFTVYFVLRSISREMVGWLRKISQIWKYYKFSTDDIADVEMGKFCTDAIADVEMAEIVYVWYGRFWNVGNSLGTISKMLKWWKLCADDIAHVKMVEILYGRYRRCWNGRNCLRVIRQILKCWKFSRNDIEDVRMVEIL